MNFAKRLLQNKYIRSLVLASIVLALFVASGFGYAFATTPATIRDPQFEHLHFRMQMAINGKALNFADKKFQEGYSADNCNAALTLHPIHFHDSKDQFVHIHWANLTGGQVLKYFGWNDIGGTDGLLGYRFDTFPTLVPVAIHDDVLPAQPKNTKVYIYTGEKDTYQQRDYQDFLHQDLETFFDQQSSVKQDDGISLLNKLFPKAAAHADPSLPHVQSVTHTQEELKRLNNVIGNVVIFVQKDTPTDAQIKAKFDALLPISESACAG